MLEVYISKCQFLNTPFFLKLPFLPLVTKPFFFLSYQVLRPVGNNGITLPFPLQTKRTANDHIEYYMFGRAPPENRPISDRFIVELLPKQPIRVNAKASDFYQNDPDGMGSRLRTLEKVTSGMCYVN